MILQLLGNGQPLSGCEDQGVGVTEVNVAKMANQGFSLLAGQPRWRGRGSSGGRSGGGSGGGGGCRGG